MNTETENNVTRAGAARRKGHVARLPKPLRDLVNSMLDDGKSYPEIATALENSTDPKLPHPVSARNICNWFEGGYQDYLRNQIWADTARDTQEKVLQIATEDPVKFADAGVQLAATGICELLAELSRLQSSDDKTSDRYARLANSMARLAKMILTYEQHRQALAKEKAAELEPRDPNKPFGDESDHLAVVRVVDKVLGLDRYRDKMVREYSLAGTPRPSQQQASATSKVALFNSADAPPPAPSASETGRDDRAASSVCEPRRDDRVCEANVPTSSDSVSETANVNSEITSTTHNQSPAISDTERAERRPWNWYDFSEEYIEKWRKENNLL